MQVDSAPADAGGAQWTDAHEGGAQWTDAGGQWMETTGWGVHDLYMAGIWSHSAEY